MNLDMNSDAIYDLMESIAATPGKNDKIAMLKACASSDLLKKALTCAYDPTISYGIKALPERVKAGTEVFDDGTFALLTAMRTRLLTGYAMTAALRIELERLSLNSGGLLRRILLKDMRAGFSESTVNKVWPGLLPEFPYMRCCLPKDAKFDNFDWINGVISQEKADGMFANVDHEENGDVFIYSRQGSMFPMDKFEALAAAVHATLLPGTQTHGEILVLVDGKVAAREIGNGILNSVLKGGDFASNERPVFFAWDQIPLSAVVPGGKYAVAYRSRLGALIRQLKDSASNELQLVETRIVTSLEDAYKHYGEMLARGKEGTVIKYGKATWRDGTSKEQVKLKLDFVVDLEVVGFEAGKGKNAATFGSLVCRTSDSQLQVAVSGITDKLRAEIHANRDTWIGKIISVRANGIMRPSRVGMLHSLFLPRFVEERLDKTAADTLQQVFDQEAAAKQGAVVLKEAA